MMIQAAAPYVQLQYEQIHATTGAGPLLGLLVSAAIVDASGIIAALMMYGCDEDDRSAWKKVAQTLTVIMVILGLGILYLEHCTPLSGGNDMLAESNIVIIENAYRIRNIQPESQNPEDGSEDDSVERFVGTDPNGQSSRMAVTAESETGGRLMHLTLQKDPGGLVRAYENTGDTQHLITPAAAETSRNGEVQ